MYKHTEKCVLPMFGTGVGRCHGVSAGVFVRVEEYPAFDDAFPEKFPYAPDIRDSAITEHWKYQMPFFYFRKRMFCYLWVEQRTGQPYLSMLDGKFIDHPVNEQESRRRMIILRLATESDLTEVAITGILDSGLDTMRGRQRYWRCHPVAVPAHHARSPPEATIFTRGGQFY